VPAAPILSGLDSVGRGVRPDKTHGALDIIDWIRVLETWRGAMVDREHRKTTVCQALAETSVERRFFQRWSVHFERRVESAACDEDDPNASADCLAIGNWQRPESIVY
jgi:hypothetical protein